jgi:hypothetical protein
MGVLLQFQPRVSEEADLTGNTDQPLQEGKPTVHITTSEESLSPRQIETKSLYPLSPDLRPELAVAFNLVNEGLKHITEAINAESKADRISSDDAIHRLQALLPELFSCRSIGDGFGSIISAIYQSIANMQGAPLSPRQLQAIKKVLSRINTEPFLELGEAVDEIMSLEDAGFEVEPSYYKYAADMLDE